MLERLRAALGGVERPAEPSASRAGPAARWRRSSSPACAARPCSAPPTPSWRRRWRRSAPAPRSSSSTATARTSACPSRTSSARPSATGRGPRSSSTSAATSPSTPSGSPPTAATTASSCSRTAPTPTAPSWNGAPAGQLRRRRRLLALRDEDDLHRRGRRARLRATTELIEFAAQVPQLRQVRARGRRPQLPDERVHRRARPGPDRAHGGDRRLEERRTPASTSTRSTRPGSSCPRG